MNYRLVSERLYIAAFNVLITGLIVHPYMLRDRVINKGTPVDMRSFSGNQEQICLHVTTALPVEQCHPVPPVADYVPL